MGAEVPYRVKVIRTVEEEVVVYAVTSSEARDEAEKLPRVVRALDATSAPEEALDI